MTIPEWWKSRRMALHLRHAEVTDLTYLMDIDLKSFPVAWESDVWRPAINSLRESCICVTHYGTPIAFAVFERDGHQLKILKLAVAPAHRKNKIGTRLIDWLVEYAKDRKMSRVSCLVCETNLTACKFLNSNKFTVPSRGGIVQDAFYDCGEPLNGYYFLRNLQ